MAPERRRKVRKSVAIRELDAQLDISLRACDSQAGISSAGHSARPPCRSRERGLHTRNEKMLQALPRRRLRLRILLT